LKFRLDDEWRENGRIEIDYYEKYGLYPPNGMGIRKKIDYTFIE